MDNVNMMFPDQRADLPHCLEAEHRAKGQQQFLHRAALGVGALIGKNLLTVAGKHLPLGGKDGILPAGQPVTAVDEQNTKRFSYGHGGSSFPNPQKAESGSIFFLLYLFKRRMGRCASEIKSLFRDFSGCVR